MAYVLLWIENLTFSLLLVATLAACIGRWRRLRGFFMGLAVFVLLLAYGALSVLVVMLKYYFLLPNSPILPVLALTACFAVGTGWIIRRGSRRPPEAPDRPVSGTWPRGKLAIGLGVVLAMHLMTYWNLDLAIRNRLETYRAEATRQALSLAPPKIADRDNAAVVYREASEAMGPHSELRAAWSKTVREWVDGKVPDFDLNDAALRELLLKQAGTIALLHRAAEMPDCRFDLDYTRLYFHPLRDLNNAQEFAHLLVLDARCRAADGDVDGALRDIRTMLLMGEHFSRDPLIVSMAVAGSVERKAAAAFNAVVRMGQPSTEQLAMLDIGPQASYAERFQRSLRLEEAAQMAISCDTQLEWDPRLLDETAFSHLAGFMPLYRVFMLEDDKVELRREMREAKALAALPYYHSKADWQEFHGSIVTNYGLLPQGRRGILSKLLMPGVEPAARSAAGADARHRLFTLAVAMYRYRATEGQYPERLDQLMPDWIVAVPVDPFDGKPIKLTQVDGRRVLYSIGYDLVDDHGSPMDYTTQVGDLTFDLVEP